MSITNTNAIAKVAAVVAGLGLVAMSFASFAPAKAQTTEELQAQINSLLATIASLQTQLGTSQGASASMTFTKDLTIGSTGADVTALQNWLIGKGFTIAAGATGYFGAQTQAALAAYQAANGISPAAGYFGPITRAKVNASAGSTGGTTTGGTTTGGVSLSGGEADLTDFDLIAEEGTLHEDESDVKIASAEFDVNDGDVDVQRVDLEFQAVTTSGKDVKPWKYLDSVTVWDGSKKLATVDAGSQDDWDDHADDDSHGASSAKYYTLSITGIHDVVKEGDTAELTFTADTQATIDSDNEGQSFRITIPDEGVRALDAAGIQQYAGDVSDYVSVDVEAASNGDLTVKKDSDTPSAGTLVADDTDTSSDYTVFAFDIKNSDSVDTKITDLTFSVATGSASGSAASDITDIVRRATLELDGKTYTGDIQTDNTIDFTDMDAVAAADDTLMGTLKFSLYGQTSHFASTGESLTVSLSHSGVTAENADNGDSVASGDISGTATGYEQAIAVNGGVSIEGNSMDASQTYNSNNVTSSYGTFTLKFDVTAIGDDVYVPKQIAYAASTTAAVVVDTAMVSSTTDSTVSASLTTTAESDNHWFYVIHEGDTETFTATVTINPTGLSSDIGSFQVGVDTFRFSSSDSSLSSLQTLDVDETKSEFHTDPLNIAG